MKFNFKTKGATITLCGILTLSTLASCSYITELGNIETNTNISETTHQVASEVITSMTQDNQTLGSEVTTTTETVETEPTTVETTEELVVNFSTDEEGRFSTWLQMNYQISYYEFIRVFKANDIFPYVAEYINEKGLSNQPVTADDISMDTIHDMKLCLKASEVTRLSGSWSDLTEENISLGIDALLMDGSTVQGVALAKNNILYKILIQNNIPFGEQIPKDIILQYAGECFDGTYVSLRNIVEYYWDNMPQLDSEGNYPDDYIASILIEWNYYISKIHLSLDNYSFNISDSEMFTNVLNNVTHNWNPNAPHVGEVPSVEFYNSTYEDQIDPNSIVTPQSITEETTPTKGSSRIIYADSMEKANQMNAILSNNNPYNISYVYDQSMLDQIENEMESEYRVGSRR